MSDRTRLLNRREHISFTFNHGIEYTCGISHTSDGRVAELFLNATNKAGSDLDVAARDAAVATSIALQYGATPEILYNSMMRNPDESPSGALGRALQLIIAHARR